MTHSGNLHFLSLLLALLCLAGTLLPLSGCTSKDDKQNQTVVATCNGYEIKYEELRFLTMLYKDGLATTYGKEIWDSPETAEAHRAELEGLIYEHLKENYVILTTCANYFISTEDPSAETYAQKQIDTIIKDECGGKKKNYRKWLEENCMTDSYLRFSLRVSYLESVLYYTLLDNHMFHYDTSNIDEYIDFVMTSEEYARTLHVYIRNDEGEDPEANRAEAERISRALKAVANPEQRLSTMHSYIGSSSNDDLAMVTYDGYYFTFGEMEETYEDATFHLDINGVSDVIASSDGYYVIMRLQPERDYVINNCATLLRNYQSAMLGLLEDSFRDRCVVEFNDYGKSIDLPAMK